MCQPPLTPSIQPPASSIQLQTIQPQLTTLRMHNPPTPKTSNPPPYSSMTVSQFSHHFYSCERVAPPPYTLEKENDPPPPYD